jgi:DNA-binding winged helix-turn-helix (wHTH) protein
VRARFGDVLIDTESRQLWRKGASVHVSLKAFDLLSLLIRHRPVAISKSDIQEHLWPSTFVTEGNIATLIAEIRAAIGETAHASGVIRTVHRFGYAFDGDLQQEAVVGTHAVRYVLVGEAGEYPLADGINLIGRDQCAEVRLDFTTVSRQHAQILVKEEGAFLEDLQSKNGTFVRDTKVSGGVLLAEGDQIRVGSVILTFKTAHPGATTKTLGP